ncbi:hypothetical protein MGYG_02316 [Nannizzia gypsea CBS 118893]|uniref:Uncharacterized protein n=1 Tax=Arthroderma gypseum (strain ATCC MYA-4604 / CBS 118893) TaxID=535722 RepID=E4UQX8_ARTGP|nr:hypothetical protein MGYG_02316 [Nannizzia gypsea CBS 118893]EFQ99304.1 hypothetical protein MGYG_02316 [Nannizzia gypsea CBS 118893]
MDGAEELILYGTVLQDHYLANSFVVIYYLAGVFISFHTPDNLLCITRHQRPITTLITTIAKYQLQAQASPASHSFSYLRHITDTVKSMESNRRKKSNASAVIITEYAMPSPLDWFQIGFILALYVAWIASAWVTPGDATWNLLARYFPGGAEWGLWVVRTGVSLVALAHAFEVVLFDQLRMRRHGVRRWSALWWTWEISCFMEGIRVWNRIDRVIASKKKD